VEKIMFDKKIEELESKLQRSNELFIKRTKELENALSNAIEEIFKEKEKVEELESLLVEVAEHSHKNKKLYDWYCKHKGIEK